MDGIVGGLIGLALGVVVSIPIMATLGPLLYGGNPVRFWAWCAGHIARRPGWIEWGQFR